MSIELFETIVSEKIIKNLKKYTQLATAPQK